MREHHAHPPSPLRALLRWAPRPRLRLLRPRRRREPRRERGRARGGPARRLRRQACGDTCSLCNGHPAHQVMGSRPAAATASAAAGPRPAAWSTPAPPSRRARNKACGDVCSACRRTAICPPCSRPAVHDGGGGLRREGRRARVALRERMRQRCTTCWARPRSSDVRAKGACTPAAPVCDAKDAGPAYEPCGGKLCGDPCTLCRPGDASCVETAVIKFCQPDLKTCRAGVPACGN